jgi:hypothetical protein
MSEVMTVNTFVFEELKKQRANSNQALNSTINDLSIIVVSQNAFSSEKIDF